MLLMYRIYLSGSNFDTVDDQINEEKIFLSKNQHVSFTECCVSVVNNSDYNGSVKKCHDYSIHKASVP